MLDLVCDPRARSPAPDNLVAVFCPDGGVANEPTRNLPCFAGGDNANYASPRAAIPAAWIPSIATEARIFSENEIDINGWQSLDWIADGKPHL